MPVAGRKPKEDRTQIRHRNPTYEFTEVDDVPFEGAPPLRDRAAPGVAILGNAEGWPQATLDWWHDLSRMPHAKLWTEMDWRFAMDSAEIHARTMESWRGYTGAEIRARERTMGAYRDALRDLRIKYVEPKPEAEDLPAGNVVSMNSYRDL